MGLLHGTAACLVAFCQEGGRGCRSSEPREGGYPSGSMLEELPPPEVSPDRATRGSCGAFKSLGCLPGVLSKSLNLECSAGHGQCLWKASHRHGLYTNRERREGRAGPQHSIHDWIIPLIGSRIGLLQGRGEPGMESKHPERGGQSPGPPLPVTPPPQY